MDDFQVVVYILLVVIYIISRALKAKKKIIPPPDAQNREYAMPEIEPTKKTANPYQVPDKPQPVTFEDLLKEFTGVKDEPEEPEPLFPVQEIKKETYQNPYLKESQLVFESDSPRNYQIPEAEKTTQYFSYDNAYKEPEKIVKADLDEIDVNKGRFGQYASYKTYDVHNSRRFRKLLHDPISIKDAVILKEILDTKYF